MSVAGAADVPVCAGAGVAVARACAVGEAVGAADRCTLALAFAFALAFCGGLGGGKNQFQAIRMAAEATNARMNRCWLFIRNLLHRIVTARTKWLTPQQAPDGHANAAHGSVLLNGFARILRTGRNKAARRRQPWRDYCFIKLQKRNQNRPHCFMWHRLQPVLTPDRSQTEVCATFLLLIPHNLLDNLTKLAEAKFFVRGQ